MTSPLLLDGHGIHGQEFFVDVRSLDFVFKIRQFYSSFSNEADSWVQFLNMKTESCWVVPYNTEVRVNTGHFAEMRDLRYGFFKVFKIPLSATNIRSQLRRQLPSLCTILWLKTSYVADFVPIFYLHQDAPFCQFLLALFHRLTDLISNHKIRILDWHPLP